MFGKRSSAALLVASLIVAVAAAHAVARPRSWTFPAIFVEGPCTGTAAPAGQDNVFAGFINPTGASYSSGEIWMTGTLKGPCGADGEDFFNVDANFRTPIEVLDATCDAVTLSVTGITTPGLTVDLSGAPVLISRPADVLRAQFCSLARALDSDSERRVAVKLDGIFQLLRTND